ncbi:glycoside hydrolase family 95 protein [candidate division KSB1 bacterium]|nr:glycoside hydrolase family 95 protein [candidate division KSB1 bacterium]
MIKLKRVVSFISLLPFMLIASMGTANRVSAQPSDLKIWFTKPASEWNEALPVGNGRLGAMVFGGIETVRLQLNEESVWTGEPLDYHNPGAREALPKVRELLFAGKYIEAQELAQAQIMGTRECRVWPTYQTLGDFIMTFGPYRDKSDYRRELDLETAIATETWRADWTPYKREVFASAPDQVLVVRMSCEKATGLSFTCRLQRPGNTASIVSDGNEIIMSEHVGGGVGVKMVARLKMMHDGGELIAGEDSIRIQNADAVTLLLTAATDYRGDDPFFMTQQRLWVAAKKSYEEIKAAHIADYQTYFKRLDFDIGVSDGDYFPTDARVAAMQIGYVDPGLIKLYYQFGRYLLISSSRPGSLPANLQGIWADGLTPPWSADYHININIQMNYWPAEITNLAEMHEPFLAFINALRPDGRKTAREVYGCRGIVAHHTTDAWLFTEPVEQTLWGMWPMGLAWSCRHLWEHYLFNEDKQYLKQQAYPAMKEASEFCVDWLVENPRTHKLVSGPSISPENRFLTSDGQSATVVMGPTMDHMIIRDLLTNTIAAATVLNVDAALRDTLSHILENLTLLQIGSDGRLLEWSEELKEAEPGHRHISHLYGLHPGNQITLQQPELLEAARKTIEYRLAHGGGHTGWSRAWIINFYARLLDGEHAYDNLLALLRKSTLSNLFDTHPPFQIDGNFGATAGITEMLIQSHVGEIHLLPALPQAWQKGHLHGACARGGFDVEIDWERGELTNATILSRLGNECHFRYKEKLISFQTEVGKHYAFNGKLERN